MKALSLYITLLFIPFCGGVYAQEVWTFEQCIAAGIKNSPEFQLRQLDILTAETAYRNPALEYLPTVSLSASHSYSIGSTIDPATNSRVSSNIQSDNASLNANMNIINFNTFTTARRNKIAIFKAKADKEAILAEYQLTLLENYFNVLYSQELLKIQLGRFENAKFNLNRIEKEVSIGSKPKSDLYDMQVSYAQEENTITQTIQQLYNQKLALLQLMNVSGENPDTITFANIEITNRSEKPIEEIYSNALVNFPKIQAAQFNADIAKKNINIQRNDYLPVVTAFYSYSSFYYLPLNQPGDVVNPFWTQITNNKNHYVGLQLSIPIFNGLKTNRNAQLAKVEFQKRIVETEQEKIKLRQMIEQETAKQQQNIALEAKFSQTRDYALKSFETTQAKFSSGLVEAIVFTGSKNQLLTTEYDLLKARFTQKYLQLKLNFLEFNNFEL